MTRGTVAEVAAALGVPVAELERQLAFAGVYRRADVVVVDPRCARAWGWLPPAAPAGAVLVGPHGVTVKVNEDGTVDEVLPGGHPRAGAASDPSNTSEEP